MCIGGKRRQDAVRPGNAAVGLWFHSWVCGLVEAVVFMYSKIIYPVVTGCLVTEVVK